MNNDINSPLGAGGKILCVGESLIDMICTDKGSPLSDGNNFLKKAGGAPTNVAAAIAALGGRAELAAKVGTDPFGKHLIDVMQSFGVSTKWVFQDEKHFTTFAFVSLMENGERDFYFNRGADGQLTEEEINAIDISEYSIIHFGSATGFLPGPLKAAYKSLLHNSFEKNIFIIGYDPEFADHLGLVDNTRNHTLLATKLAELGHANAMIKFIKAEAPAGWERKTVAATPPPVPTAAKTATPVSPAKPVETAPAAERKTASVAFSKDDFKNDPLIQKALEIFKGTIVEVRA